MALKAIALRLKRKKLMRLFTSYDMRYHTDHLGQSMAKEADEFGRQYHREKLHKEIQQICERNDVGPEQLLLIEDDLNEYINNRVRSAYDEEMKKQKLRELLDTRIKIKQMANERDSG